MGLLDLILGLYLSVYVVASLWLIFLADHADVERLKRSGHIGRFVGSFLAVLLIWMFKDLLGPLAAFGIVAAISWPIYRLSD